MFYPPLSLTNAGQASAAAFEKWASYPDRPVDWLHHSALTRNRLATVDRLFHAQGEPSEWSGAPRSTIADWLGALIGEAEPDSAIAASIVALETAALIPSDRRTGVDLGRIVLTEAGEWQPPDPGRLFLPDELLEDDGLLAPELCVHQALASDPDTRVALHELGFQEPSLTSRFEALAARVLTNQSARRDLLECFWVWSRELPVVEARAIIEQHNGWRRALQVRTRGGDWRPLHSVLMPGDIVPGDGTRDDDATVNPTFHAADAQLLRKLGVTDLPEDGRDLSVELAFLPVLNRCRNEFRAQPGLEHTPQRGLLNFLSTRGVGPVGVLAALSEEGRALYTDALLGLDACFSPWIMRHEVRIACRCSEIECEPPVIRAIRRHGRVETPGGIVPFEAALGPRPRSPAALHALLRHPNAERIRRTFGLAEPIPEVFGVADEEPRLLTDVWPGLGRYLNLQQSRCTLVRCSRIRVLGELAECVLHSHAIYLADATSTEFEPERERHLRLVVDALPLTLSNDAIQTILDYATPEEIEQRREAIRDSRSDAQRLLLAVGVDVLSDDLPGSLLDIIAVDGGELTDGDIAEAAIAAYGTGTLRHYRSLLEHLDPPWRWAGSRPAVEFVRSLGFPDSWAGAPATTPDPFVYVDGPRSLPELHDYQRTIVDNVLRMIRAESASAGERRGMISLPTGSGKTRVAVQAIVEAMRDGHLDGPILWVAHRGELCEQAVEAWRQVWANIGREGVRLRVSRLWGGQEVPRAEAAPHVVVATVQTLRSRIMAQREEHQFLASSRLVVFDEAHRSIAPEYTTVMGATGLSRFRGSEEPLVLGLSATPYRGYNEDEGDRLSTRYGRNRLDWGAFGSDDPQSVVRELQRRGFLARADHETLEGGTFRFDDPDLELIRQFVREAGDVPGAPATTDPEQLRRLLAWLPPGMERRIADDIDRTRRIVERCAALPDDWPILVFATSVEHAQTVAALLRWRGVTAGCVSGTTDWADRQWAIEGFRGGDVRALVNYNVLTEGFDAPMTRAIVVARPVYSPNLYFQMIGRGLRGPENGGKERCLILNVEDNFEQFGHSLAFAELDWLWDR